MAILGRIVWNVLLGIGITVLLGKVEKLIKTNKTNKKETKTQKQTLKERVESKGWRVIVNGKQ